MRWQRAEVSSDAFEMRRCSLQLSCSSVRRARDGQRRVAFVPPSRASVAAADSQGVHRVRLRFFGASVHPGRVREQRDGAGETKSQSDQRRVDLTSAQRSTVAWWQLQNHVRCFQSVNSIPSKPPSDFADLSNSTTNAERRRSECTTPRIRQSYQRLTHTPPTTLQSSEYLEGDPLPQAPRERPRQCLARRWERPGVGRLVARPAGTGAGERSERKQQSCQLFNERESIVGQADRGGR